MPGLLTPPIKFRYTDANNEPLAAGKVYTYISGTNTPLITWVDVDGNANNTNPVILDANGAADIFLQPGKVYRFTVTDANDVALETTDGVAGATTSTGTTVNRPSSVATGTSYANTSVSRTQVNFGGVWREYNGLTSVVGLSSALPGVDAVGATFYATDVNALLVQDSSGFRAVWVKPVFVTATNGGTTTVAARGGVVVNTESATLATHTLTLPSGSNVADGDRVRFASRGIITTLTVNGGTVYNAPSTLVAGGFFEVVYDGANTAWHRIG